MGHHSENYGYFIGALCGVTAIFLFFIPENNPNRYPVLKLLLYAIGASVILSFILDFVRRYRGSAWPNTYFVGLITGFSMVFEAITIALVIQTGDLTRFLP